ncbi:hypothetical protein PFISCL1PPCAC_8662, partial [Pristionchus fissidentatus]
AKPSYSRPMLPPPPIPLPRAGGCNVGLIGRISDVVRGVYFDAIAQVISLVRGETGTVCLIVWDGTVWDNRGKAVLAFVDPERRPGDTVIMPPTEELREKTRGRQYHIFCGDDFDRLLVRPIESGSWVYLENCHVFYKGGDEYSSLYMHNNSRSRKLWRLDLPMAEGLFYEREWKAVIERTSAPLPALALPPVAPLPPQFAPGAAAGAAAGAPVAALARMVEGINRIVMVIIDKMIRDGAIRMPTTDEEWAAVAQRVSSVMDRAAAPAAA